MMKIPKDWRPLSITGNRSKGFMMLGDSFRALMQVKWQQPEERRFDPNKWMSNIVKNTRKEASQRDATPFPKGFQHTLWLPDVGKNNSKALWYGYGSEANLILEVVLNLEGNTALASQWRNQILPTLSLTPSGTETFWAVFDVSFTTPPGFDILDKTLHIGDMALRFKNGGGSTLMMRQVYPAELALSRREMKKWLIYSPFKDRRKYREFELNDSFETNTGMPGMNRKGVRVYPFPLAWISPRHNYSVIVHDMNSGRLLITDYDSIDDEQIALDALNGMNWAQSKD